MTDTMEWLDASSDFSESQEEDLQNWDKLRSEAFKTSSQGNWEEYVERDTGDTFWYNRKSQEYTYIRPSQYQVTENTTTDNTVSDQQDKNERSVSPPSPPKLKVSMKTSPKSETGGVPSPRSSNIRSAKAIPQHSLESNSGTVPPPPPRNSGSPNRLRPRRRTQDIQEESDTIIRQNSRQTSSPVPSPRMSIKKSTLSPIQSTETSTKKSIKETDEVIDRGNDNSPIEHEDEEYSDFSDNYNVDGVEESWQTGVDRTNVQVEESQQAIDSTNIESNELMEVSISHPVSDVQSTDADLLHHTSVGEFMYFSGILADHDVTWQGGTYYEESYVVLNLLRRCVEANGLKMSDVAKIDIYLNHIDEMPQVDEAFFQFFPTAPFPARTITGNCALQGGANFQIACIVKNQKVNKLELQNGSKSANSMAAGAPPPNQQGGRNLENSDFFRRLARRIPVVFGGVGNYRMSNCEKESLRRKVTFVLRMTSVLLSIIVASLFGAAHGTFQSSSTVYAQVIAVLYLFYSLLAGAVAGSWVLEYSKPALRPQQPKISKLVTVLAKDESGKWVTSILMLDLIFLLFHVTAASAAAAVSGSLAIGSGIGLFTQAAGLLGAATGLHFILMLVALWTTVLQVKWYLLRFPSTAIPSRGALTFPEKQPMRTESTNEEEISTSSRNTQSDDEFQDDNLKDEEESVPDTTVIV